MANASTLLLTVALLATPIILFAIDRFPKWLQKFPFVVISLVVLLRIIAFWRIDLTDAQVVGYLPEDVSGLAALLYIFSGPDGLMLGLLFGFSIGLALRKQDLIESRWSAFLWVLILGWEINPEGFSSIAITPLSSYPSTLDWQSAAYPVIGFLLSTIVLPTMLEMGPSPSIRNIASFSILIAFIDLSNSPIAWMLLGLTAHRLSASKVDYTRGIASRRRWLGLLLIFSLSLGLLVYALILDSPTNESTIWASRYAIGWILLCGIAGALTPLAGFDSRPRPEAWGFLSGLILAPALLPNLHHIEVFHFPIIMISIIMPWVGTLPEFRPKLSRNRRLVESLIFISIVPLSLFFSKYIPKALLVLMLLLPLFISITIPVDEEE